MYFLFNPNRMIFEVSRLKNISGKLHGAAEDVISAERVLDPDTYQTVLDRLKLYGNNLCETGKRMDGLSQGLSLVRDEYFNTENRICGKEGAPDWLKLLGEGGEKLSSLLDWLGGGLPTGSFNPNEPWIVTMGGRSVSFLADLFNGENPYIDSANGIISISKMGGTDTRTSVSIPGLGDITETLEYHFRHFTESENNGYVLVNDNDDLYGAMYGKVGYSLLDGSITTDFFGKGTLQQYAGLLNLGASTLIGGSLYVDGEYDPGFFMNASISGTGLQTGSRAQYGTDDNAYLGAELNVISGNVGGNLAAGRIVREDGTVVHGISGGLSAEANLVQVGASGGIDWHGLKIDLGASLALGAGIGGGAEITTGNIGGNFSIGPVGVLINADWTNFDPSDIDWPEIDWPEIDLSDWEFPEINLPDLSDWELPDWELPDLSDWELPDWELPDWLSW